MQTYKKLGILGGMGPLATYALYRDIILSTATKRDEDQIPMSIANATDIPDRTAGILGRGESPLPRLTEEIQLLERIGCDIIAIPCNTSHYYIAELQKNSGAYILNMIDLTAQRLNETGAKRVYLTATEGTVKTKVYEKWLAPRGVEVIPPNESETAEMMRVIYAIKANENPDLAALADICKSHADESDKVVLGCTELSVVREQLIELCGDIFTDAMDVLKDEILRSFGKI
ncbi:aspartate racemase [Clostridia bacterium]|nr:aspartate racemase [Clostridia bacterium]